jgi:hypothetical protein
MGNHAFFGRKQIQFAKSKNDSKTRILIEPSFENASAEVCLCENVVLFTNGFGILSGKF